MGRAYQGLNKDNKISFVCKTVDVKHIGRKKCFHSSFSYHKKRSKYYIQHLLLLHFTKFTVF